MGAPNTHHPGSILTHVSESRIAEQVGRVLGGRYRLIAPIGVGASGDVYLADDTQLRRQVAVKVLHRVLADDEVFLRRFRDEAQMAASLSHPNIVAVHDWGEDDLPFIVTEYLGGGSLRAMLDAQGSLSLSQALLIGLETTRGLEYAHRRGVVQRDIKPGNLLFDAEGHLRIADFGLAKALAEASATEPSGSLVGTIRYASPEQAQGHRVEARSDVYSLALVLAEVVSGAVPFDGDTSISTLMARVGKPLELGEEFGPLRGPLERAGRDEAGDRPDAGELHVALMAAAEDLPRPEPLPLVGAISFDPLVDSGKDATLVGVTPAADGLVERDGAGRRGRLDRSSAKRASPEVEEPRRRRRWPWMMLMALVIAAAGVLTYVSQTSSDPPVQLLADASGLTPDEFRAEVADFWQLQEAVERLDGSIPGTITRTEPKAGAALEEGELVTFWVSQGNEMKTVPIDLIGLSLADATLFITGAELEVGEVTGRNHEESPVGTVIEVDEVEPQLPGGSEVDLIVSDGPSLRTVPDTLVGLAFAEAESQLALERLAAVRVDVFDNAIPLDQVISVEPEAGTELSRDAEVTLTVSKGPEPVAVPNVSGSALADAVATLQNAGCASARPMDQRTLLWWAPIRRAGSWCPSAHVSASSPARPSPAADCWPPLTR